MHSPLRIYVLETELRFYEKDGWSSQLLTLYITKGSMVSIGCENKKYWTLERASSIDTDRMILDFSTCEVMRIGTIEPLPDYQVLRSRAFLI